MEVATSFGLFSITVVFDIAVDVWFEFEFILSNSYSKSICDDVMGCIPSLS